MDGGIKPLSPSAWGGKPDYCRHNVLSNLLWINQSVRLPLKIYTLQLLLSRSGLNRVWVSGPYAVIVCAERSTQIAVRTLAPVLLTCALISDIRDYRKFWIEFSARERSWSSEVQKWKKDKSYSPVVWPTSWKGLDSYPAAHTLEWHLDVRK